MFQAGYFLLRNTTNFPRRTALIYKDQEISYADLNRIANRLANSLSDLGIKKGDRVAYLFRNCSQLVFIWYAIQKIGATAVPLNVYLLSGEIRRTLETAECRGFIFHEECRATAEEAAKGCGALKYIISSGAVPEKGEYSFEELCSRGREDEAQIELKGEDEALLLFTSGTTGISKGVVRTQQCVRDYALMMAVENGGSREHEVLLTHCPMFHTAGLSVLMKMAALCGTMVLLDKVETNYILKTVEKYGVTQILMVPPILYVRLSDAAESGGFDLSKVKEARASGGRCSLDYAEKIFRMFPNAKICLSWGSTETCSPTSAILSKQDIAENPERIECVGKLNVMTELRLVDENGADVPLGEVGEAIVRSSMVSAGYIKKPELTDKVLKDGWFYTEDMMRQDKDGYYYLVDRKRDMVKTGGENVYAQEVEGVLLNHPAIEECAVVGLPDSKFGVAVAVAIVLSKGRSLDFSELTSYCKERMPSYKKPRYAAYVKELPRNSMGKIQKNVLRDQGNSLFIKIAD